MRAIEQQSAGSDGGGADSATPGDSSGPIPLVRPRDGMPPVITTPDALRTAIDDLATGSGPVAIDAERASGYRYSSRAYLVQLRRAGAGTRLIDPIACPDLTALGAALADTEWILHAALQDLPCLAEVGLTPTNLFDTELAGRLLSLPKVGLGPLVEDILGYRLEKGHGAADWSTRPLPAAWLIYATLDVELLIELRDALDARLRAAGKAEWARQEFTGLLAVPPRTPRAEPWRRTSGIHRVRGRRDLAYVRELWGSREHLAEHRDIAPGRVLPDRAIVAAALAKPRTRPQLAGLDGFGGRTTHRDLSTWWSAIQRARDLDEAQLPEQAALYDGPPPARSWSDKDPDAAARLNACRTVLRQIAEERQLPVENLLAPDTVRRLSWDPPAAPTPATVAEFLTTGGVRPWQVDLTAAALAAALSTA